MNRTEFNEVLDQICKDIAEKGGNMKEFEDQDPAQLRYLVAVALMATDRYYSNLTHMDAMRREKDPFKEDENG